jgi:hypothetical protein
VLAMLAVLRVAPLLPSPTLRAVAQCVARSGRKSRRIDRTGKCSLVSHCLAALAMHFYSGPPMHLLSGVDSAVDMPARAGLIAEVVQRSAEDAIAHDQLDRIDGIDATTAGPTKAK